METGTLFHTLAAEAVSVIVKQLKLLVSKHNSTVECMEKPDKPEMFDRVSFLALLFSEKSPFRSAAAMLVSEISLSDREDDKTIYPSTNSLTIGSEMFEGEAREMELVRNIFSACGPYVRRLFVSDLFVEDAMEEHWVEQCTPHVFRYCRNVEEIMFYVYDLSMSKWVTAYLCFRKYATNLRKIDWYGEEDENGLLDLGECVNIRRLYSNKLSPTSLLTILKASGSKLEELRITITPDGGSVQIIEAIRSHCKKLSVLLISNSKEVIDIVGQESYSSLIRGYGPQLKNANTYGLDHEHLVEVVRVCTNLEVEEYWRNEGSEKWGHIYDLGPRVLRLKISADGFYGNEYISALEQCSNLRDLSIYSYSGYEIAGVTDETIANVFSQSRFPKLEYLSIRCFWPNQRNMGLIASCTTNLKSVHFGLFELDPEVSGFQLIADSNRNLKDIKIVVGVFHEEEETSEESALEWLSEVVKIFRKCRNLSIIVSCSNKGVVTKEDLIRTCKVLPCRGVNVDLRLGSVEHQNKTDYFIL